MCRNLAYNTVLWYFPSMGKNLVYSGTVKWVWSKQYTVLTVYQVRAQYLAGAPMSNCEMVKKLVEQIMPLMKVDSNLKQI